MGYQRFQWLPRDVLPFSYHCRQTQQTQVVRSLIFRFVVVVKDKIEIYSISNMRKVATIEMECDPAQGLTTAPSYEGAYALTPGTTSCFFAFTTVASPGSVHLANLLAASSETEITAHTSPVVRMAFDIKGGLLATASRNVSIQM